MNRTYNALVTFLESGVAIVTLDPKGLMPGTIQGDRLQSDQAHIDLVLRTDIAQLRLPSSPWSLEALVGLVGKRL